MVHPTFFKHRFSKNFWQCRAKALLLSVALLATTVGPALATTTPIKLKRLGDEPDYSLKTVRSHRDMYFTRPTNVTVAPTSALKLSLQHSAALLPQRSFLSILLNNRVIETIRLTPENVKPTGFSIPIDPKILKDDNKLTFLVDQHYTNECEDPFSAELWTSILPETQVDLTYTPNPLRPDLARFPFPFMDEYGLEPPTIQFYLGQKLGSLSSETLEALGVLSTRLGQYFQWRPVTVRLFNPSKPDVTHIMAIGTPSENPQVLALVGKHHPKLISGNQWVHPKTGKPLSEKEGILVLAPHPEASDKGVLVISGNSPQGVAMAAHFLAQEPNRKLLSGPYAIVNDYVTGNQPTFRQWKGFIQQPDVVSLGQLGLKTETSRGFAATPIFYSVRKMPDVYLQNKRAVHLKTVFSYSSQLDASQSKLEVRWNGKTLKSYPLNQPKGENLATVEVDIPTNEVYTYNDLEYKFQLYPEKLDLCRFVTDAHIWGTIHSSTTLDVDGEFKTPVPDMGLLNDAGFPLSIYSDMAKLAFALPEHPEIQEIEAMIQFATRLGRQSQANGDVNLSAYRVTTIPDNAKKDANWVVIGSPKRNPLIGEFNSKLSLLMNPTKERELSKIDYSPNMGLLEMALSPWNQERVGVLISGETDDALWQDVAFFASDYWYNTMGVGNVVALDQNGARSITLMKKGDARFTRPEDYTTTGNWPDWLWWLLGVFAAIGGISVVGWLLRSMKRR